MSAAEAMHRAWIVLASGSVFAGLTAIQLWAGKVFIGFAKPWHPSPWAKREREPLLFWFHVGLSAALAMFLVGLGLVRIL